MPARILNEPVDISEDFFELANEYFVAGEVTDFNAQQAAGKIRWNYHRWVQDWSFNQMGRHLRKFDEREIFWKEHETHPQYKFSLSFLNARTFRLIAFSDGDVDVSCSYYFKDEDEIKLLEANFSDKKWKLVNEDVQDIFTVVPYR